MLNSRQHKALEELGEDVYFSLVGDFRETYEEYLTDIIGDVKGDVGAAAEIVLRKVGRLIKEDFG